MAARVAQQVLRTVGTPSRQMKRLDEKFENPFTFDGAEQANVYNSIMRRPTPTMDRVAQVSGTTTKAWEKAYATVAPAESAMPLKSTAGKFRMAFDEGPYLKPTLDNVVDQVEMLSRLMRIHGGAQASAEGLKKILKIGEKRL